MPTNQSKNLRRGLPRSLPSMRQRRLAQFVLRYRADPGRYKDVSGKQGYPKSSNARNTFRWYQRKLVEKGVPANCALALWRMPVQPISSTTTASSAVEVFRKKHKQDLYRAAATALSSDVVIDGIKEIPFRVPRSVVSSGAVRYTMPSVSNFIIFCGNVPQMSENFTNPTSNGPFAGTYVLVTPTSGATPAQQVILRPLHVPGTISYGAVVWPVLTAFDTPVLQTVTNPLTLNCGFQATLLTAAGSLGTCAVSGYDARVSALTSISATGVSPIGSWKAGLGPVMNTPETNREENFSWYGAVASGGIRAFAMGQTADAPWITFDSVWTSGASNVSYNSLINPGGVVPMARISRRLPGAATASFSDNSLDLPFLVPAGRSGRMLVTVSGSTTVHYNTTSNPRWVPHSEGFSVIFTVPNVVLPGALTATTVAYQTRPIVSPSCTAPGGSEFATVNQSISFDVLIPPFATAATIVWGCDPAPASLPAQPSVTLPGNGGINVTQLWGMSVAATIIQDAPVLRPAVYGVGISPSTSITATFNSVLVTESTPNNSLVLGTNPIGANSEELMADIEGMLGHSFASQLSLSRSEETGKSMIVEHHRVTPPVLDAMDHQVSHGASETGFGAFLPFLASVAGPLLSKGASLLKNVIAPAAKQVVAKAGPVVSDMAREAMSSFGRGVAQEFAPPPAYNPNFRGNGYIRPDMRYLEREMDRLRGLTDQYQQMYATAPELPKNALRYWNDRSALPADETAVKVVKAKTARKVEKALAALPTAAAVIKAAKKGKRPGSATTIAVFRAQSQAASAAPSFQTAPPDPALLSPPSAAYVCTLVGPWLTGGRYYVRCEEQRRLIFIAADLHEEARDIAGRLDLPDGDYLVENLDWGYRLTPAAALSPTDPSLDTRGSHCAIGPVEIITRDRLDMMLRDKQAVYGVGVLPKRKGRADGSLWAIFHTKLPAFLELPNCRRAVEYEQMGSLFVDRRLAASFGDLQSSFARAVTGYAGYLNSVCELDTSEVLHVAYGGSLLAPALCAMAGFAPPFTVSGSPVSPLGPALTVRTSEKEEVLKLYRRGVLPSENFSPDFVSLDLRAVLTDGANSCPTPDEFVKVLQQSLVDSPLSVGA